MKRKPKETLAWGLKWDNGSLFNEAYSSRGLAIEYGRGQCRVVRVKIVEVAEKPRKRRKA